MRTAMKRTTIIGCALLTVTGLSSGESPENDDRTKALRSLQAIRPAIEMYRINGGLYPSNKQGLRVLVSSPYKLASGEPLPAKWTQILKEVPKDPWGAECSYQIATDEGQTMIEVRSFGADGKKSDDDIVYSWKPTKEQ